MLALLHHIINYMRCYFLQLVVHPMIIHHIQSQVPHAHWRLNRLAFVDLAVASPVVDHRKCEILLYYSIDDLYR